MPDRYLATFFDQFLWNIWGLSWFASLKEHADFPGSVVVIGTDLSDKIKSFLTNHDVILVPLECQYNQRDMDVLHSLAIFSSYVDAHVCYIPKELQFSADSIKFHFKNRFPDLYRKWHQFYNDVPSRLPIKLLRK